MIKIQSFTFNPFQENTYIAIDTLSKDCIIFDPGCSDINENKRLLSYIAKEQLNPVRLINTHCHIDHVLGNHIIAGKFALPLEAHRGEIPVLEANVQVSKMYGIPYIISPDISTFIESGDQIELGNYTFEVRFTPGHSPASLCFIEHESKQIIAGDVLFLGSIGRTDLPGGSYKTLIESIGTQLMTLPDDYIVYCGHGPSTTIGHERRTNPFLNQ